MRSLLLVAAFALLAACSPEAPEVPAPTSEEVASYAPGAGTLGVAPPPPADSLGEAPAFTLPRLGGGTLSLDDYRGRVVLVNFWATWCPPCLAEIPDLVALQDELGEEGLTVIGISLDEEGFEVVEPFAEAYSINYPIAVDDGSASEAFSVFYGLPTTFVIDREGRIARRVTGIYRPEQERPVLEELLNDEA